MNKELRKFKDNPVLFAEEYLEIELKEWQKEYLRLYFNPKTRYLMFLRNRAGGRTVLLHIIQEYNKLFEGGMK